MSKNAAVSSLRIFDFQCAQYMFHHADNHRATLITVSDNVDKRLTLEYSLMFPCNHTYVPRNAPLCKPVSLRLVLLPWHPITWPINSPLLVKVLSLLHTGKDGSLWTYYCIVLPLFLGHRSLIKNKTQTAMINILNLFIFIMTWRFVCALHTISTVTFENVCRAHTKRQVIMKMNKFNMFITAVCVLFLIIVLPLTQVPYPM